MNHIKDHIGELGDHWSGVTRVAQPEVYHRCDETPSGRVRRIKLEGDDLAVSYFTGCEDALNTALHAHDGLDQNRCKTVFSSRKETDTRWTGSMDMPHALHIARRGWEEGAEATRKLASKLLDHLPGRGSRIVRKRTVNGPHWHIAEFLSGEPMCGRRPVRVKAQRGAVTLMVQTSVSCGTDRASLMRRAAVACAFADYIERMGGKVEVIGVNSHQPIGHGPDTPSLYATWVPLKREDDRTDIPRLAFWTGHPSATRRIDFALREALPFCIGHYYGSYHSSYGIPHVVPPILYEGKPYHYVLNGQGYASDAQAERELHALLDKAGYGQSGAVGRNWYDKEGE